jgi:hypothetical protein
MLIDAYKPRLEEILNDIILISEVAELSIESENIASVIGVEKRPRKEPPKEIQAAKNLQQRTSKIQWSQVKFDEGSTISRTNSESAFDDESTASEAGTDGDVSEKFRYYDSSSSRIPIKDLLDKWEEPISKRDKVSLHFVDISGF